MEPTPNRKPGRKPKDKLDLKTAYSLTLSRREIARLEAIAGEKGATPSKLIVKRFRLDKPAKGE